MSVLIDGYYVDSNRGMGRYIREVIDAAARYMADVDIHVLVPKGAKFQIHPQTVTYHVGPQLPFPLWEQVIAPWFALVLKPDVFHSPYNTFPLAHAWRRSQIVTIHDLMFIKREFRTMSLRQDFGRLYRSLMVRLMPYAKVNVTTLTQTVARDIDLALGRTAPIHVTPVDFFVSGEREDVAGLPERFALHVGGAVPHKNTAMTIKAFRRAGLTSCKLLVLGIREDHPLALEHQDADVIFPGWLTDGQILTLYDRALAVVFPSLMEGYGLPSLEGMACDCVVVTSNRNPMMELADDAALLVDPLDEAALAAGIAAAIDDPETRATFLERSRRRMQHFSGQALAASLETIYRAHARPKNG